MWTLLLSWKPAAYLGENSTAYKKKRQFQKPVEIKRRSRFKMNPIQVIITGAEVG